jgi:2-aminoethylphosphonate-pyruvate transaminase
MNKTAQWRYTPPTHVVAALDCAVEQYLQEGGLATRGARYARNCKVLIEAMAKLGLKSYVAPDIQAPIIVTFLAPNDPHYDFKTFYQEVKKRGYLLYPGKLTTVDTFRVGCIGHFGEAGIPGAVAAIAETLKVMGVASLATSSVT